MLVDTDILIWYMRGSPGAAAFIADLPPFSLSAVTYMELVQGMRNKRELLSLRHALRAWRSPVLPITEAITGRAVRYVEQHFLSHALRLADALIVATAVEHGMSLATANTKHYEPVGEVSIRRFIP
jgi:predicted nucleic acid-binding protein